MGRIECRILLSNVICQCDPKLSLTFSNSEVETQSAVGLSFSHTVNCHSYEKSNFLPVTHSPQVWVPGRIQL